MVASLDGNVAGGGASTATGNMGTTPTTTSTATGTTTGTSQNDASSTPVTTEATTQPTTTPPSTTEPTTNPPMANVPMTTEPTSSPPNLPDGDPPTEPRSGDVLTDPSINQSAPFCSSVPVSDLERCVSDADCTNGQTCYFDDTPSQCNLGCQGPFDECNGDQPCPEGTVCTGTPAIFHSLCSCGGGTYCAPPCAGNEDCGTGERCDSDGACRAIPCLEGWECPAAKVCEPGAVGGADVHGCRFLRCTEDGHPGCGVNNVCDPDTPSATGCRPIQCETGADCECGACSPVGGECVSQPGFCSSLAVPG